MKTLIITLVFSAVLLASPATARFTGRMERFTTITGKAAVKCEFELPGRKFWKSFLGYTCPATINVD